MSFEMINNKDQFLLLYKSYHLHLEETFLTRIWISNVILIMLNSEKYSAQSMLVQLVYIWGRKYSCNYFAKLNSRSLNILFAIT